MSVARRRSDIIDQLVRGLFEPVAMEGLAVAALGGYGRRELTPASDIDLIFVYRRKDQTPAERSSAALLYPLWDAGLRVSHSVRTQKECRAESRDRLESLTALLSIRHIAGSIELVTGAWQEARSLAGKSRPGFVADLERSRKDRSFRYGSVQRSLEPELKESLGGYRDLQLMGWINSALFQDDMTGPGHDSADLGELVAAELLSPLEANHLREALDSILLLRTALHLTPSGRTNRLAADDQHAVAALLDTPEEIGWEARDVLMRDLFIAGRRTDLTVEAVLRRMKPPGKRRQRSIIDVSRGAPFGLAAMAAIAAVAEERGTLRSEDRDRLEEEGARYPDLPWSDDLRSAFLRVLRAGEAGSRALELLDSVGLLARFIPEWNAVRGRAQRDPYHRFPVDVHLFSSVAEVAELIRHPNEPFATEARRWVDNDEALLLGTFLHDIGKVGRGSHVDRGAEISERVLHRMGVPDNAKEIALFLVREHLLLSDTATRRNLQDEDLVLQVAGKVGDQPRLGMLYLLTIADATSTGPSASTPWRLTLLRELVAKVNRVLDRGLVDRRWADRLTLAERTLRDALAGEAPPEDIEAFLRAVPPAYVLTAEPSNASEDLRLVVPRPEPNEVRMRVRPGRYAGSATLTVATIDRVGLLANLTGALTLSGLSIHSASAFTTGDGVALDIFEVRSAFEEQIGEERWSRFRSRLEKATDLEELADSIRSFRAHYRPGPTEIPVKVEVDQRGSDFYTVLEVHGPDRLGLLFDLARALSEHGIDVHSAKVATYGPRVVDVFYVTDQSGTKVTEQKRVDDLIRTLSEAVAGG